MLIRFFKRVIAKMAVIINGVPYEGREVFISSAGEVRINGVVQPQKVKDVVKVVITDGTVHDISSEVSIECGRVAGDATAGTALTCGDVTGDATAGTCISCRDVFGDITAGTSVTSGRISGDIVAGDSVIIRS